jgi:hypothetical protein
MKANDYLRFFFVLLRLFLRKQGVSSHGSHEGHVARDLEEVNRCGTPEATELDIATQQLVVEKFLSSSERVDAEIVVPVCFYVISDTQGNNSLSDSALQGQLDALNRAYGSSSCCNTSLTWCAPGTCSINTGISFAMAKINANGALVPGATLSSVSASDACVTRVVNNAWAYLDAGDEMAMKTALKKGDEKTLDIYFTDLRLLGFTSYPWAITPGSIRDGVVVQASTVPGGSNKRYNEGDTLAHEVGHWMGLSHTFAGSCDISDGIEDTPPQANAYSGCSPAMRPDTCPGGGPDPIFNFMDYSLDACMYEFTKGQALAMRACYTFFRLDRWENEVISLRVREQSAPLNLIPRERQIFRVMIRRRTTCTVSAKEGNADMYMNLLSPPSWSASDLCKSNSTTSAESCSTGDISEYVNSQRRGPIRSIFSALTGLIRDILFPGDPIPLYVGVVANGNTPVQNFTVRCSLRS